MHPEENARMLRKRRVLAKRRARKAQNLYNQASAEYWKKKERTTKDELKLTYRELVMIKTAQAARCARIELSRALQEWEKFKNETSAN